MPVGFAGSDGDAAMDNCMRAAVQACQKIENTVVMKSKERRGLFVLGRR